MPRRAPTLPETVTTTTATTAPPQRSAAEKNANPTEAEEKAMEKEVIAECKGCKDHSAEPASKNPAKEAEVAEKKKAQVEAEVRAIERYKAAKEAAEAGG